MDYSQYYIQEFKKYIALQTSSINTIKNYLSDLRLFLSFISQKGDQPLSPQSLPVYISEEFLSQYESYLSLANPPATTKRRVSSLKKFIDYCRTQGILPLQTQPAIPTPYSYPETPVQQIPPAPVAPPTPPVEPTFIAPPIPTPSVPSYMPSSPPAPAPTFPPIPQQSPVIPQTAPPQIPEPLNFYQPTPQPVHQPIMSQSPFAPSPQPDTPTPPAPTTSSLVHSFESLFPEKEAAEELPRTSVPPVVTDYVTESEPEHFRSRKVAAKTPGFLSYMIASIVSFLICMGLTLLITLVLLK
jgi:hypothetical protein